MSKKQLITLVLVFGLVFATASNAMAAPTSLNVQMLSQYGAVVDEQQLDEVEGELAALAAGAIAGAVGGAFYYATSPGEKSLKGLGGAIAIGAGVGVVTAGAAVVGAIATGVEITTTVATAAWASFGAANAGALQGALEHLKN